MGVLIYVLFLYRCPYLLVRFYGCPYLALLFMGVLI